MADSVAEVGELVVGSSEEVKLPRQRSAFPKPTKSTAICRASYTSTPTARPPIPLNTARSSMTSRRTGVRIQEKSEEQTARKGQGEEEGGGVQGFK